MRPRPKPFAHPSWLAKLITGDNPCWYSGSVRSRYTYNKLPSTFDFKQWNTDHATLVEKIAARYTADGFTVTREEQNEFMVRGKIAIVPGKADIVAVKEQTAVIVDAKTGKPKEADAVQVLIYLLLAPGALPQLAGVDELSGVVEYADGSVCRVAYGDLATMRDTIIAAIKKVAGKKAPPTSPSFRTCRYCDVPKSICADRVEREAEDESAAVVDAGGMF